MEPPKEERTLFDELKQKILNQNPAMASVLAALDAREAYYLRKKPPIILVFEGD